MDWALGRRNFLRELESLAPDCRATRDAREATDGDRLFIELGANEDELPGVLRRANRAGVTAVVCASEQLPALLGVGRRATATTPEAPCGEDPDIEAWRAAHAPEIVGGSESLADALEMAERVAHFDCPVLITGESGTGKELLARAIHRASPRSERPFVTVNCPAIPSELVESELFGHTKGAFTGAVVAREGRFVAADKGTLFLDEIGEMSHDVQAKLLRTLQDFEVTPVGESRPRSVDVRIIAATNRDLEEMSERGQFRLDLFFRLNVVQIHLPALRERPGDVPILLEHHIDEVSTRLSVPRPELDDDVRGILAACSWPGNIRQLRNVAERLVILRGGRDVRPSDLPTSVRKGSSKREEPRGLVAELPVEGLDLRGTLAELESRMIREAILATGGNKNQAAKLLGLNRTTLVEKLKKLPELAAA